MSRKGDFRGKIEATVNEGVNIEHLYTQLLCILCTLKRFYTNAFTHAFDPFALLHFNTFTLSITQGLSHTATFGHSHFYTQTLYTQTRSHTVAFAQDTFRYTQIFLHGDRDTGTRRNLYTPKLLHTNKIVTFKVTSRQLHAPLTWHSCNTSASKTTFK